MNSDSGIQPGGVGIEGAGAKYCAPTFNALYDSGVQWDGNGKKAASREKQRLWLAGQNRGYRFVGEIADLA